MLFTVLISSILLHAGGTSNDIIADGYTNTLSAFPGDSVELFINAHALIDNYEVKLFSLGKVEVARFSMSVFPQPTSQVNPYENGYGYKVTKKIAVPSLKSGVYMWENKIPFIIKSRQPGIVVLYSSNTENAYCNAGGKSLYGFNSSNKSATAKVSFHRPIPLPRHSEAFLRWIAKQDLPNVSYITDMDMDDYHSIKKASLLIIPGHSEYWTLQARKNYDRFLSEGKNVMVLSGNTMWWQVRYNQERDQLICYRNAEADPIKSTKLKTVLWNDIVLNYPILSSIGAEFSLAGYGCKDDQGWDGYKIISRSPLLTNTSLEKNSILYLASDELDGAPLSGFVDDIPILNKQLLGFEKAEIVGFDLVSRGGKQGVATWIVFKQTKTSGIVINTGSTNWCADNGIGSNRDIQTITMTMIKKLQNKENVFSPDKETLTNTVSIF